MKIKQDAIKRVKKVSLAEEQQEVDSEVETRADKIEKELEKVGISFPKDNTNIDGEYLTLPFHLDECKDFEIGRYHHALNEQRIWVRSVLAKVAALYREENEKLDKERQRVYANCPPKITITEKELQLYSDEQAQNILNKVRYYQEKMNMLTAYMENMEDAIFDVSREITRRGKDIDNFNRNESIQSMRRK